jgi:hypothetical protein
VAEVDCSSEVFEAGELGECGRAASSVRSQSGSIGSCPSNLASKVSTAVVGFAGNLHHPSPTLQLAAALVPFPTHCSSYPGSPAATFCITSKYYWRWKICLLEMEILFPSFSF